MRKQPGPKRFTEEFRREAVRLATESERSLKAVAAELGVTPPTLRSWMREVARTDAPPRTRVVSLEEQVRQLKRENERLREEREILKKGLQGFQWVVL